MGPALRCCGRLGLRSLVVGLLREAVDTLQGSGAAYWTRWRKLTLFSRADILAELIAFRVKESFGKIAFIIAVTAIVTAVGAALAFVPVGYFGASLTMGERNPAAGALQGSAGGFVWRNDPDPPAPAFFYSQRRTGVSAALPRPGVAPAPSIPSRAAERRLRFAESQIASS